MKKLRATLDKTIENVLVGILTLMVINVMWQVFTRYFTSAPSPFTEELARYLMIWLGLLGGAYVSGLKNHVAIDVFLNKFKPKTKKIIQKIVLITIVLFAGLCLVIGGGRLVYITLKLQQYSPALHIPLALVYAVLPLSGLLVIFYKLTENR